MIYFSLKMAKNAILSWQQLISRIQSIFFPENNHKDTQNTTHVCIYDFDMAEWVMAWAIK